MRQRVRINPMVVDQMLLELVGRQEPQLTLGALAHVFTIALLALALTTPAGAQSGDPLRGQQWHLDQVHAEDAWRAARGKGVVVAVVDTGVDASHPDLEGRVLRGIDMVDEGTPADDPNGHGTLVAGIAAAIQGNGVGVAGASPDARILPVRVLDAKGDGDSDIVARGVRWAADNGAHVINLSLAEVPGLLSDIGGLLGNELLEAIRYADQRGAVVVAASGNDGRSTTPYPSDLPLLVVGATDQRDQVWASSNRDARTVFAPGVGIVSTWRDHGYGQANGTSFATPIVSAAAAILRERGLTSSEIRARIESTTTSVGAGRGRVDLARAAGEEPSPTRSPTPPPGGASEAPTPDASPSPGAQPTSGQTSAPGDPAGGGPPVGETVAPATIEPLPSGAGDPVATQTPSIDVGAGPNVGTTPPRDPLRWIGALALLGVLAAFARAARRP